MNGRCENIGNSAEVRESDRPGERRSLLAVMLMNTTRIVIERPRCNGTDHFFDCVKTRQYRNQVCSLKVIDRALPHPPDNHGLTIRNGRDHCLMAVLV